MTWHPISEASPEFTTMLTVALALTPETPMEPEQPDEKPKPQPKFAGDIRAQSNLGKEPA